MLRQRQRRTGMDSTLPIVMNPPRLSSNNLRGRKSDGINTRNVSKIVIIIISISTLFILTFWINSKRIVVDQSSDYYLRVEGNKIQTKGHVRHRNSKYNNEIRDIQQQRNDKMEEEYSHNRDNVSYPKEIASRHATPPEKIKQRNAVPLAKIVSLPSPTSAPNADFITNLAPSPISNESDTQTKRRDEIKHTKQILCSDNKTKAILNDDYCDCPDGSDEPNTSACSNILVQQSSFKCFDGKFFIHASRFNDGVKDCMDGSDESGVGSFNSAS